jgi:hypothetical protein
LKYRYIGILLVLGLVSSLPAQVAAQELLTMSFNRNVEMAIGSLIQGTFTLHGSGPEIVQNLTVYFNGGQVHFVTGNTITWQFDTANYPSGSMNITLFGVDDAGVTYVASEQVTFIGGVASNLLTFGIIAFVAVILIVKYGSRLIKSRK